MLAGKALLPAYAATSDEYPMPFVQEALQLAQKSIFDVFTCP